MTQPKYLIRPHSQLRISQIDDYTAHHPEITKDSGKRLFGLQVVEGTGKVNKNQVAISPKERGDSFRISLTSEAVKSHIRKLRDIEATKLNVIDEQMEFLRQERRKVLQTAWIKANVVTLKEIVEKIESEARNQS
jgi:hypothetical protein